jgi:DNA-binding Xre family transcriptional regulator
MKNNITYSKKGLDKLTICDIKGLETKKQFFLSLKLTICEMEVTMKVIGAFKLTDKIQQWLNIKGWTQREFSKELGVDESYISQIFSGEKHLSWQMLRKFCTLTGLDVGDIIYFDRNAEQEENG